MCVGFRPLPLRTPPPPPPPSASLVVRRLGFGPGVEITAARGNQPLTGELDCFAGCRLAETQAVIFSSSEKGVDFLGSFQFTV